MMADLMEKMEEGWWLRFLWRAKASKRSRVDIADTILVDNGVPSRWLFTAKDGEVKKKGEDKTSKFHEVFLGAAGTDHNNPHGLVAVTRGPDGAIAVHDVDQFKALISGGIGSYVAVQRFMPMRGGDGSLYRTTYEVVNDTGHTVCTTAKLTKVLTPEKAESKDHLSEVRSLDRGLNSTLESIAKRVVRDLEEGSRARVIQATLDFILQPSTTAKPVLIWVGNVHLVQGEAASDLRKAGLMSEGDRYFDFLLNKRKTKDELQQPLQRGPTTTGLKPRKPSYSGLEEAANVQLSEASTSLHGSRPKSPPKSPMKGRTIQLGSSMQSLDASDRLSAALTLHATDMGSTKEQPSRDDDKKDGDWFHISVLENVGGSAAPWCAGAYCNCRLKDPAAIRSLSAMEIAREFFPADELGSLSGELEVPPAAAIAAAAVQSRSTAATQWRPEQGYILSKRSIVLAQQDLEQRKAVMGVSKEEEEGSQKAGREGVSRAMAPTSSTKLRTSWAARRGDVAGGLGNYYQEVKVCPTCYLVYSTLDRARALLKEKEAQRLRDSVVTVASAASTSSLDGAISLVPGETAASASKKQRPVARKAPVKGRKAPRGGKRGDMSGSRSGNGGSGAWARPGVGPRRPKASSTTSLHLTSLSSTGGTLHPSRTANGSLDRLPRVHSAGSARSARSHSHGFPDGQTDSFLEDPSTDTAVSSMGDADPQPRRRRDREAAREERKAERQRQQLRKSPVRVAAASRSILPDHIAANGSYEAAAKAKLDKPKFQSSVTSANLASHEQLDSFLRGNAVNASMEYPADRTGTFLDDIQGDAEEEHLKEQAEKAEARLREQRKVEREALMREWQGFLAATWGEDAGKGAAPEGKGWRGSILVVENDPDVGVAAVRALATAGYFVYTADDGPKALTLTRSLTLDAVLVAAELPSLNGTDISRIIRQREERAAAVATASNRGNNANEEPHVPILALTEHQEESDLQAFMEAGMDGCVAKPLHIPSMLSTMEEAVPYPVEGKPDGWDVWVAGYTTQPMSKVGAQAAAAAREVEFGDSLNPLPAAPGTAAGVMAARVSSTAHSGGFVVPSRVDTAGEWNTSSAEGLANSTLPAVSPVAGVGGSAGGPGKKKRGKRQVGSSQPSASPTPSAGEVTLASIAHLGHSSTQAAASQDKASAAERAARGRTLRLSDGTSVPFLVLGKARKGAPLFNLVIVHDFFDNLDAWQVLLSKTVDKYPGLQVLLFNVPGQANTSWPENAVLNNEFQAAVMQQVLLASGRDGHNTQPDDDKADGRLKKKGDRFVGSIDGPKECEPFAPCTADRSAWFFVVGVGNGGNIATMWASDYAALFPNMRAVVTVNSFLYMDPQLSAAMHDCANVFACTPASRPDLPLYFFSRFLFSPSYIKKVGAPMALNIYTAVANPITIEGRIKIAQGALAHKDLRTRVKDLLQPFICVLTDKSALVNARIHSDAILTARQGEERSLKECLKKDGRVCFIWYRGGHEVVQECRTPFLTLIEQLVSGYHERNDVAFLPLLPDTPEADNSSFPHAASVASASGSTKRGKGHGRGNSKAEKAVNRAMARAQALAAELDDTELYGSSSSLRRGGRRRGGRRADGGETPGSGKLFEDHFLDTVVNTLRSHETLPSATPAASPITPFGEESRGSGPVNKRSGKKVRVSSPSSESPEVVLVQNNSSMVSEAPSLHMPSQLRGSGGQGFVSRAHQSKTMGSRKVLNEGSTVTLPSPGKQSAKHVPEVREYMSWRIRRNKKRLERIENCAIMIQRCWRAYLARTMVSRMRFQKAALDVQRWWRGVLGRRTFERRRKMVWAALLVQRNYRGHRDRVRVYRMQLEEAAARDIQRVYRGYAAKKWVRGIHQARRVAATKIQSLMRKKLAERVVWRRREQRHAATQIQRVWRGRLGRARAVREKDRFLFSKAQSQGIEFGRQMLMEHKMQATKLQSEVSLLTQEKIKVEEEVEDVLREIATFEAGVRSLEKEMVELSRAEAEAAGMLDSEAKVELRENKMRLDREFGAMLVKIADRREKLKTLEGRLASIERARQAKKEDLKDLERKLVVLLEEQQSELEQIKQRQERRGERHIPDQVGEAAKASGGATDVTRSGGDSGGGGGGGPTPQERAEANALMASTETMMKFGFMSMSMTYFSSLNMIRAMRKVGTANTVLANPLLQNAAAMQAQLGGLGSPQALGQGLQQQVRGFPGTATDFKPKLQPGALPGQENTLNVNLWTVADVGAWLDSLSLGQYKDSFADAAVDGAFLYDLTDEDLKNTLGIEHGLHRKKILNAVRRLRAQDPTVYASSQPSPLAGGPSLASSGLGSPSLEDPGNETKEPDAARPADNAAAEPSIDKLISWARHGKGKKLSDFLRNRPNVRFDPSSVETPYLEGFGTQYDSSVPKVGFHMNAVDKFGNTMLIAACQNGHKNVAQLLIRKGANPNHQNNQGQTALHFAMSYNFHELGSWLVDEDGGKADDGVLNRFGLGPYDGLQPEG